jgi:Zn-dependent peptidase ImmA (M78 family)
VDVFAAIRRADVPLMFHEMTDHFGTYISPATSGPGILLNSGLAMPTIRHTAAHELGHHQFGHGDSFDRQLSLWDSQAPGMWTGPEMSAEAFAAWFLMPRPAVLRGLRLLGIERPQSADHAYRLATLLGVSFRGICRHLVNLDLISASLAAGWAKAGRARVRTHLAGPYAKAAAGEVHVLDTAISETVAHVADGDLLIATRAVGAELTAICRNVAGLERVRVDESVEEQLDLLDEVRVACWRVTSEFVLPVRLGANGSTLDAGSWSVAIEPASVRNGIDLEWLERHQQSSRNLREEGLG